MIKLQPTNNDIILKEDDKITTDELKICDIFNDQLSHVTIDIDFEMISQTIFIWLMALP